MPKNMGTAGGKAFLRGSQSKTSITAEANEIQERQGLAAPGWPAGMKIPTRTAEISSTTKYMVTMIAISRKRGR